MAASPAAGKAASIAPAAAPWRSSGMALRSPPIAPPTDLVVSPLPAWRGTRPWMPVPEQGGQ
jgi:hypothetical protein